MSLPSGDGREWFARGALIVSIGRQLLNWKSLNAIGTHVMAVASSSRRNDQIGAWEGFV